MKIFHLNQEKRALKGLKRRKNKMGITKHKHLNGETDDGVLGFHEVQCNSGGNCSSKSRNEDLEVETTLQASGATEVNLKSNNLESSHGKDGVIDSCTSTGDSIGQSRHEGTDKINLVPTEKNCPGEPSFQCAPSACAFAQVESNSDDKQKESDHSEEAASSNQLGPENGDPTKNPSACETVDCSKNNLNAISNKPESSPVILIIDRDDKMATNEMGVHMQDSSNSTQKRKRSTNEGENDDGSSFGRQTAVLIPELVSGGNHSSKIAHVVPRPEQNLGFIRRCEDKVGVSNGNDSDSDNNSCSTKEIDMMFERIRKGRKWLAEADLRSAFEKDPELCLNAVCALSRQQISENKSSYSMSQDDELSITVLGKYLIDEDPEKKLRRTMSEVSPKDHGKCKQLAIPYCHQLFQLYHSKKDHLFCPGAGIL
ncbi:hypothetical protein RND71_019064 [Anisodus tanguticus]|uniref:Uncharacterized protein n=1 Tax=Anisodus tanguticus TaxID=243964 RepID=A0AAE1S575_9SOLA|nr:hypothetical protein RND71_019064 [Anisodus tanguticus]